MRKERIGKPESGSSCPAAERAKMPKNDSVDPVKETCRLIRLARSYWDAHRNSACRTHRDMAMKVYESLSSEQKEQVPQVLRVWLRYRSEKYFGPDRTAPGTGRRKKRS